MKKVVIGTDAVAEGVMYCRPDVIAAYPITPQSHLTEKLSKYKADGKLKAAYVPVESEFSAISCVVGASAYGARTFTATSSQGLALMHEVVYAAAGMRLPVAMVNCNRALSAPINIWNDEQDSMAERDSGWLQVHCETNQEAVDSTIMAFKIAEDERVLLPMMVNMDGFYMTHMFEPVEVPAQEGVDKFLPEYVPKHAYLDPKRPVSQGPFAGPEDYFELRHELEKDLTNSKKIVEEVDGEFKKQFGRGYGLVEEYGDGKTALVALGSVMGNVREVCDQEGVAGIKVKLYRPFPKEEVLKALEGKDTVIVLDKNVSLGTNQGSLYADIRNFMLEQDMKPKLINMICGLGGKDVPVSLIADVVKKSGTMKSGETVWK